MFIYLHYWNPCRFHWNTIIYKRISGLNVSLQVQCPGRTTTMAYSVYWWYGHFSRSTWDITHHFWNGRYQDIHTFSSSLSWEQQFSRAVQYWQWYCRGDIQPHSGVESAGYVCHIQCITLSYTKYTHILVVTCMCTCTFLLCFLFTNCKTSLGGILYWGLPVAWVRTKDSALSCQCSGLCIITNSTHISYDINWQVDITRDKTFLLGRMHGTL